MNNYINKVLKHIKDKDKNTIKLELENLLEEKEAFYSSIGYDDATAFDKACENLGDTPDIVGEQLSSIHSNNYLICVIVFITNILFLINSFIISMFDLNRTLISVIILLLFAAVNLVFSIFSLRRKIFIANLISFIFVIINIVFSVKSFKFLSLFICFVGQGRINDIFMLMNYNDFEVDISYRYIIETVLSVMVIILFLLLLSALFLTCKFNKCKFRKKDLKREKVLNSICICCALLLIFTIVFLYIKYDNFNKDLLSVKTLEGVHIVESDNSSENLEEMKIKINTGSYYSYIGYGMPLFASDIEPYCKNDEKFEDLNVKTVLRGDYIDNIIVKTSVISATYKCSSRYIYIVPEFYCNNDSKIDMNMVVMIDTYSQENYRTSFDGLYEKDDMFYELTFVNETEH